ncbi:hypothetical protein ACA910_019347 [Epithemia clementina (nom. ined.)]
MKVSAFAFASLFSSAAAVEFSLRSAINSFLESAATETYDARIVIGGLYDMVSDDEVKYVSKEVVAAYNNAFGFDKAGQRIGNMETRGFSTIPSDSFWWTDKKEDSDEEAAFINAQVEIQYYKDGFGAPSNWGSLHQQFEQDLCDRLRKSGFANLAHAKDCFFSFLEHGGLNNQGPVETAYANEEINEAQITLVGLKNEMSQSDNDLLNKVVTEAHSEAFSKSGLSIASFQTIADIPVGEHLGWLHTCGLCCPYDDDDPRCCCRENADEVTIVVGRVAATGASSTNYQVGFQHAKISHADFENFVCFKLRSSGNPTFEGVHDCRFNFVYNPKGHAISSDN